MPNSPPLSPSESETFSFVDPPSPFPQYLVLSDPFEGTATCSPISVGKVNGKSIKKIWDTLARSNKGKAKQNDLEMQLDDDGVEDHAEEDMLVDMNLEENPDFIDDEACYCLLNKVPIQPKRQFDLLKTLPPEISIDILSHLSLTDVISVRLVSKVWNTLCSENTLWRSLFFRRGWGVKSGYLSSLPREQHLQWKLLFKSRYELERRFASPTFQPSKRVFSGHTDSVYCLEYLKTSYNAGRGDCRNPPNVLITGSRDNSIKIWDLNATAPLSVEPLLTLKGHKGSVLCLKFDESGFMVSGSSDCCVFIWDLGWERSNEVKPRQQIPLMHPRVVKVLKNHSDGVLDIRISDKWIVTCSKDASLVVYHRDSLAPHLRLRGHDGPVNSIGLHGDRVVSASGDMKLILWDISREGKAGTMDDTGTEGRKLLTMDGHEKGLACVEFMDEATILSGSNDCTIRLWCATTGNCLRTLRGHTALVRALSYDPFSGMLVSASYDRSVRVWDLRSIGKETEGSVREYTGYHRSHIFGVGCDCAKIISSSHDHRIVILDFSEGLDVGMFC